MVLFMVELNLLVVACPYWEDLDYLAVALGLVLQG
jgi:hypothetical protein